MEAKGLVNMLTRAPETYCVSICTIISDDDSNGRAKAKHICNGGLLPGTVEEPQFLADPLHRKRVFTRAVYNLASAPAEVSKVCKGLAAHIKYCYGACMKCNHHLPATELSGKVQNILQHICGIHNGCDVAWCYDLKAKERSKVVSNPKDHRSNKDTDANTYAQKIFDQYASVEQMAYCNHPFDMQTNESLTNAISTVVLKTTCYSGTIRLFSPNCNGHRDP
jgi:hypothetical protein